MVDLTYPQTEYTQINLYKQYFESDPETNFIYCQEFILFFYAKMVDKTNSKQSSNSKHDSTVGKKNRDTIKYN